MPPEDLIDSGGIAPRRRAGTPWQFATSRRTLAFDRAPRL